MKKNLIFLFLCLWQYGFAQETISEHIKIGNQVPDVNINVLNGYSTNTVSISDFRGKIVILEFWATFCGPCIPAMEHFADLKRRHSSLEVFAITKEPVETVTDFLRRRPTSLKIGIDMYSDLNTLFYHQFMPHTVIIDKNGKIAAITSPEEVNDETIRKLERGEEINIRLKSEFTDLNPNSINETTVNPYENSIYKVALMPRRYDSQMMISKPSSNEYKLINCTIPEMVSFFNSEINGTKPEDECVRMAMGFEQYETIDNSYCLDIIIPSYLSVDMPTYAKKQIETLFQLNTAYEFTEENSKGLSLVGANITENPQGSYITLSSLCKLLKKYNYIDFELENTTGLPDSYQVKLVMPKNSEEVLPILNEMGLQITESVKQKTCLLLSKGF